MCIKQSLFISLPLALQISQSHSHSLISIGREVSAVSPYTKSSDQIKSNQPIHVQTCSEFRVVGSNNCLIEPTPAEETSAHVLQGSQSGRQRPFHQEHWSQRVALSKTQRCHTNIQTDPCAMRGVPLVGWITGVRSFSNPMCVEPETLNQTLPNENLSTCTIIHTQWLRFLDS